MAVFIWFISSPVDVVHAFDPGDEVETVKNVGAVLPMCICGFVERLAARAEPEAQPLHTLFQRNRHITIDSLILGRAQSCVAVGSRQPLPRYGMVVAVTVMNDTFASSGKRSMNKTASTTLAVSIVGSVRKVPSA